jgi:hypothetical protein
MDNILLSISILPIICKDNIDYYFTSNSFLLQSNWPNKQCILDDLNLIWLYKNKFVKKDFIK